MFANSAAPHKTVSTPEYATYFNSDKRLTGQDTQLELGKVPGGGALSGDLACSSTIRYRERAAVT